MEEFLNKDIETPFANTILKLQAGLNNKQTKGLLKKDLDIIRTFFQFALLRNKVMYNKLLKESQFVSLVSDFSPSAMLSFSQATDYTFNKKRISIIHNLNDNNGFVCPHNVVYYFYNRSHKAYNLAITINTNIILCLNINQESEYIDILEIDKDLEVRALNCATYLTEKNHDNNYIVGKESDLNNLIDDIKKLEIQNKDLIIIDTKK